MPRGPRSGWVVLSHPSSLNPKFSSWSLILTNLGRYFHALSARLRPIVRLKRITNWVNHFQFFQSYHQLYINFLPDFYSTPTAEFRLIDLIRQ